MCRREGVAAGLGRLAALNEGAGDAETLVRDVLMLLADSLGTGLSFLARVDGETATTLVHVFERLSGLGTTVVIATQDIALARQFGCLHLHLERGELTSPEIGARQ